MQHKLKQEKLKKEIPATAIIAKGKLNTDPKLIFEGQNNHCANWQHAQTNNTRKLQ